MKSFIAKRVISILVNLRYLRFKLLKYKENNKKMCNTFDHNFKNIPLYIMSNVSLERYYFVSHDGALTLKMSKMALNAFCDKTLQMLQLLNYSSSTVVGVLTHCLREPGVPCINSMGITKSRRQRVKLCILNIVLLYYTHVYINDSYCYLATWKYWKGVSHPMSGIEFSFVW